MARTRERTAELRPAVFLDKDGTLVEDVPFNVDPARIRLGPGAADGLAELHRAGFPLVVVSNQPGVARGLFPESALAGVWARLAELLAPVPLAGCYHCPHGPADGCDCRKPEPGLLRRAAAELGLDLGRSWMVGDILNDVEAGRRAGCRTVLIDNGNETEWVPGPDREPHYTVRDLAEAAGVIRRAAGPGGVGKKLAPLAPLKPASRCGKPTYEFRGQTKPRAAGDRGPDGNPRGGCE